MLGDKELDDGLCVRKTSDKIYELYGEDKIDVVIKLRRLQWLEHIETITEDRPLKMKHGETNSGRRMQDYDEDGVNYFM